MDRQTESALAATAAWSAEDQQIGEDDSMGSELSQKWGYQITIADRGPVWHRMES